MKNNPHLPLAAESSSLRDVVRTAFFETHHGHSPDDVVIDDNLNSAFIAACLGQLPAAEPGELNWTLLNLRKQPPGLGNVTTVKRRDDHRDYVHAAEIAARHMEDKYRLTIDRALCDPAMRREFDGIARSISPDVETYLLRKAALKLRKTRQLKPELIKRLTDWGKKVTRYKVAELLKDLNLMPRLPGVYVFLDRSGYLYIGEAGNLRGRIEKHLDHSDRKAVARYLWDNGVDELEVEMHAFEKDSDGNKATCRKAYEAELIRSRAPRFNVQG
jgi:predicted GIY-YIG superfamily endonuclease